MLLLLFFAFGGGAGGNGGWGNGWGNNMNNAIRDNREAFAHELCDLRHQLQTNHCATLQAIKDGTDSLEKLINARDMKKLEAQNLKLQNELVQNEQTEKIIKAMAAYHGCNPCTPCAPCCPDVSYQNQVLSALNGIATGIQSLSTTQQAQGTTLASILTRVNELPTT